MWRCRLQRLVRRAARYSPKQLQPPTVPRSPTLRLASDNAMSPTITAHAQVLACRTPSSAAPRGETWFVVRNQRGDVGCSAWFGVPHATCSDNNPRPRPEPQLSASPLTTDCHPRSRAELKSLLAERPSSAAGGAGEPVSPEKHACPAGRLQRLVRRLGDPSQHPAYRSSMANPKPVSARADRESRPPWKSPVPSCCWS